MKILMFGRGVINTQYAWALEQKGHRVHFYVRPGRAAEYGPAVTLDIYDARRSARGVPVRRVWPVTLVEDLDADHDYDLIIVSLQHYKFAQAARFLSSRVGGATILAFNNFWDDPRTLLEGIPGDRMAWGFPAAGGGFRSDASLRGAIFGQVQFGTFGTDPTPRELAVRAVFKDAGFAIKEHRNFLDWLRVHFAVNAGLHMQALLLGEVAKLWGSRANARDTILNVRELIPLLRAKGVDTERAGELTMFRLPLWLGSLAMTLAPRLNKPFRAVIEAIANLEELRSFVHQMDVEAQNLNVSTPRLKAAVPRVGE